ncbi:MAG: hypothetical protein QOF71_3078, partial [Candidatus Eremiobacteraeota bacterium]|nr:hypothetical protein [Candidatus Eremiobacteraeota bacterium]
MIPVTDAALYTDALTQLSAYAASVPNHKGRLTQVFLALKFYGAKIPGLAAEPGIPVGLLQDMVDRLYLKVSMPDARSVLSLFSGNYMPRTGVTPTRNGGPANNWRNNFDIQKGVGCYAGAAELSDPAFLEASRLDCPHLLPAKPGSLARAKCALHLEGEYRREDHPKWLQIRPGGSRRVFAVVDLSNTSNFTRYIAPGGRRIPAVPLVAAMYFDADAGAVTAGRTEIDMADFQADFNMTAAEFAAYFDDDPANIYNDRLMRAHLTVGYARV